MTTTIKELTEEQLNNIGKRWVNPKNEEVRYYLDVYTIAKNYPGLSKAKESVMLRNKFYICNGSLKTTLSFKDTEHKYIMPYLTNAIIDMVS